MHRLGCRPEILNPAFRGYHATAARKLAKARNQQRRVEENGLKIVCRSAEPAGDGITVNLETSVGV
jgi:hypothetical protein